MLGAEVLSNTCCHFYYIFLWKNTEYILTELCMFRGFSKSVESGSCCYHRINVTWWIKRSGAASSVLSTVIKADSGVLLPAHGSTPAGARHGEHRSLRHWPPCQGTCWRGLFTPATNREGNAPLLEEQPTYHKGFMIDFRFILSRFIHREGEEKGGRVTVQQCLTQQIPVSQWWRWSNPHLPTLLAPQTENVKGGHSARCSSQKLNWNRPVLGREGEKYSQGNLRRKKWQTTSIALPLTHLSVY